MELVIASALLGIVGLSFGFIYTTAQRFLIQSANFTGAQGEASFALEHIKRYLLLATVVTNPAAAGAPLNLSGGVFTFTWQPTVTSAATVTSRYRLNGTNLEYTTDGNWTPIARDILTATVTRTAQNGFDITIVSQMNSGNDINRQSTLRTMVNPRGL